MTSESNLANPSKPSEGVTACRLAQVLMIVVATMLHGIFLSKAKPLQSANDRSRWCTVWSLVERGTFQIDEIRKQPGWDTIDLVHVDDHFYSTKPPLLTVVVAGITWCVQKVSGWSMTDQTQSVTFVVLMIVNLIPFVLSLAAWVLILDLCTEQPWTRLYVLAIAAFGTLITPFLMTLNNHTVAAAATSIALYALLRILKSSDGPAPIWAYLLCGLATGWAVSNELPAAAFGAIVFILLDRSSLQKTAIFFVPAAAISVLALMITNVIATGSWKPFYADYGTDKYRFVIDGIPSYWMQPQGVDQNRDTPWVYFKHCLIGHHGIFSLTPAVLLALAGWVASFRWQDRVMRMILWTSAATSIIVIAFYMTRTQNYNYGGVSCGLRWAIWLTPLWLVAMIPMLDVTAGSKFMRVVAILMGMVSIYSAWQPIDNPWRQPWLFKWMESRGWIDYSDPRPKLERPLWTWFASLPRSPEPAWIEFQVTQPGVSPRIVRMTAVPASNEGSEEQLELEIRESTLDEITPAKTRKLLIDVSNFNQGAPPVEFLSWADPNVTETQQQADLALVRGLPRKVPYSARATRYLKTSMRKEAFRCVIAAAHVAYASSDGEPLLTYRCDTWLTDDVPFGFVQVEWHISDPDHGADLFHERWTVRDCWPKPKPYYAQDESASH